ncbi:hypothetical protein niasHT_015973 [Heterodera trifolii]|uniref:Uncharacterized protein n=1 Tax=Heterodera trifolii TaxID=157864 RepID=A0ABD2KUP1_9BILA
MLTYFSGFIHRKQDNEGYLSLTVATIDDQGMYSLSLLDPDNARLVIYQQHKMYDDLMEIFQGDSFDTLDCEGAETDT